jgi:hypothetical protein
VAAHPLSFYLTSMESDASSSPTLQHQTNQIRTGSPPGTQLHQQGFSPSSLLADPNERVERVMAADLQRFVKSKQDLIQILKVEGGYLLPDLDSITLKFLKCCLGGSKKLLTLREASPVSCPKLKEFNSENLFREAMADPVASLYLPEALLGPKQRSCGRRYLFTVSRRKFPQVPDCCPSDHQYALSRLVQSSADRGTSQPQGVASPDPEQVHRGQCNVPALDHEQSTREQR